MSICDANLMPVISSPGTNLTKSFSWLCQKRTGGEAYQEALGPWRLWCPDESVNKCRGLYRAPGIGAENESTNVSAARLWYVSFECVRRTYRRPLPWMRLRMNWCMESPRGHCKAYAVCDQEQSKRSSSYGIPLWVLHRWVVSSPAHEEARLLWA